MTALKKLRVLCRRKGLDPQDALFKKKLSMFKDKTAHEYVKYLTESGLKPEEAWAKVLQIYKQALRH